MAFLDKALVVLASGGHQEDVKSHDRKGEKQLARQLDTD